MPTRSDNTLFHTVQNVATHTQQALVTLAVKSKNAVIFVANNVAYVVGQLKKTGLMKKVGKAAYVVFDNTVVELGKGAGNGVTNFAKFGYAPVDEFKPLVNYYTERKNFNPFYIAGNAVGAVVVTPIAGTVRVVRDTVTGLKEGAFNFAKLGYAPVANMSDFTKYYKDTLSLQPFYYIGTTLGMGMLPLGVMARVLVDAGYGVGSGFITAFDRKDFFYDSFKKDFIDSGSYVGLPFYALAFSIAKPVEFTARKLSHGLQLGWKKDYQGYLNVYREDTGLVEKTSRILTTTLGFGIGRSFRLTADGTKATFTNLGEGLEQGWKRDPKVLLKILREKDNVVNAVASSSVLALGFATGLSTNLTISGIKHTATGFKDGVQVMVPYVWFTREDLFTNSLYKRANGNYLHNVMMLPGAMIGLGLGEVFSTVGGLFYGFGKGTQAAYDFSKANRLLSALDTTNLHQKFFMIPAHVAYAAGITLGGVITLVTKPFHSKQNLENTVVFLAIPVVAPFHYGQQFLGMNREDQGLQATSSSPVAVVSANSFASIPPSLPLQVHSTSAVKSLHTANRIVVEELAPGMQRADAIASDTVRTTPRFAV